jgi:hypothetical protein|tara:strand:+ start:427 stop:996 length:570 start_codon:yes stop_codon:yes gene_type:complete
MSKTYFPIFPTSFFWKFRAVNVDELNTLIDSIEPGNEGDFFSWGNNCVSQKKTLDPSEWIEYISPNLEKFSKELGTSFQCQLTDCWINFYEKTHFQEVHSHIAVDFVMIYFPQKPKEGFSKLFFLDRFCCGVTHNMIKLLKLHNTYYPDIDAGDVLFFPSYLQHGVTPHNNEEMRKTLSANFVLMNHTP